MKNQSVCSIIVALLLLSGLANAEQKKVFDGPNGSEFHVHYIAFPSTFLQPEIAQQYQLIRSKAVGIINISVIQKMANGTTTSLGTVLEGRMTNDIQQQQMLSFQQVTEGKSVYYLAQVQFSQGEVLTFDVTAYPQGHRNPLKLRFTQTFYND